jgi:hypothetical protein
MQDRQRKLNKAIFLLIENYHRLYGLEAYLFSGGHGPGYVGFQIAANRCWDDRHNQPNYGMDTRMRLVTYICGPLALPAWANQNKQLECPGWERLRTLQIVDWLEENLTVQELFQDNLELIQRWQAEYTVEQSEKYLLMINLAGILAARLNDFPRTPSQCFSEYDPDAGEKVTNLLRLLEISHEQNNVMGTPDIQVARNGMAVANNQVVDVWALLVNGLSVPAIADELTMVTGIKTKIQTP